MYMDLLHVVCMCAACVLFDHADYLIVQELRQCYGQALSYLQMLSFFLAFYNQMDSCFYINTIITPEDQSALFIYRSQT